MTSPEGVDPINNTSNEHPTYRPDIDGLRAIAILSVVVFHAFPTALNGGFVGVDVFFVISGFLISSIIFKSLRCGNFSFSDFYARRINRIFPALISVLVFSYAFGWLALLPAEYKELGAHIAGSAGFFNNFLLWQEAGYFDTASEFKPLMHLWSLGIEEQFYLIYPALVWGAWRFGAHVLAVLVFLIVGSFALNIALIESYATATFYLPHTRFWELLCGGLLAYAILSRKGGVGRLVQGQGTGELAGFSTALGTLGLLLIVAAVFGLEGHKGFPGWWALLPVIGTCLLIAAGPTGWINRKILGNRIMLFVGAISYPLYLWHWPLLSFARIMETELPAFGIRAGAVVLSVVLAWLTYRVVERPFRFGRRSWTKTGALFASSLLIGSAGFDAYERDGLAFRHEQLMGEFEEFARQGAAISETSRRHCRSAHPQFDDCALEHPREPTVVLIGDSHSNRLYPGLAVAYRGTDENLMKLGHPSCLPFFGVSSAQRGTVEVCRKKMADALSFAESTQSVKTIIMASRGPLYLTGQGFGPIPEETILDHVIAWDREPLNNNFVDVFQKALAYTFDRLLAKGKRVVFVLDIPELGFDPKRCFDSRPLRLSQRIKTPCAVARQAFDARNHEYRNIVRSVAEKYPEIKIFDAAGYLCDSTLCIAMKNGNMLYRDNNHLTTYGSEYIAANLVEQLGN